MNFLPNSKIIKDNQYLKSHFRIVPDGIRQDFKYLSYKDVGGEFRSQTIFSAINDIKIFKIFDELILVFSMTFQELSYFPFQKLVVTEPSFTFL